MTAYRTIITFAAVAVVASVLAGCRAEEQGRPLILEKGNYRGPLDTKLDDAKLQRLRDRAVLQSIGAGPAVAAPLRQAASASAGPGLAQRLRLQVGRPDIPSSTSVRPPGQPQASAPATAPPSVRAPNTPPQN